jgi:plasmid stabilization system protein ParE
MRVRWTTDAADDLERICGYVARERPEAARRLALDVLQAIEGPRAGATNPARSATVAAVLAGATRPATEEEL